MKKVLVVLTLCLCALRFTSGGVRTAGRSISARAPGVPLTVAEICKTADEIGKSFCNGEKVCDSKAAVVTCTSSTNGITIPCPTDQPFCVSSSVGKATCSAESKECPQTAPTFQCTGVGYYPDPSNCKKYYNCYKDTNGDIKAEAIVCPSGYVFDPNSSSKQFCLFTSSTSKCVTVTACDDVDTTKNVAMNYANNALFVALCIPKSKEPLIFQCPKGTKANLNDVPVTCTFICKTDGQFEYAPDNNLYYDCRRDAAKRLYSELKACPARHVFEKTVCVRM